MSEILSPQSASMVLLVLAAAFSVLAVFLGFTGKGGRRPRRLAWIGTASCLTLLLTKAWLLEPFYVPSASMAPTLLEGDLLIVQKYPYRLSWPIGGESMVATGSPARSDVVVFSMPQDPSVQYVKRVVGVPGDDVVLLNGVWHVNARPLDVSAAGQLEDLRGSREALGLKVRKEVLAGRSYLVVEDGSPREPRSWRVPDGHVFVLGDNRGMSLDSRDFGFVPQERVVGRASRLISNTRGMDRWFRPMTESEH